MTILARNKNKIPDLNLHNQISLVQGDMADRKLLRQLTSGQDVCIHTALCLTSDTGWGGLQEDTAATLYLAEAAAEAGVKNFIYTSSTSVNDYLYEEETLDGEEIELICSKTRHSPCTSYGATKAASEIFLMALSYRMSMRVNIIRPGYTFGDPVIENAPTQADTRFRDMVRLSQEDQPITVGENDGTQFIWAGHLAVLFALLAESDKNRKIYFGLSNNFVSWKSIAEEIVGRTQSGSEIVEEKTKRSRKLLWETRAMEEDFNLCFNSRDKLSKHISENIHSMSKTG